MWCDAGSEAVWTFAMRTFFRVLWFLAPILVMLGCVFVAFYALVEMRMNRWDRRVGERFDVPAFVLAAASRPGVR
jgi:hypothetical protein